MEATPTCGSDTTRKCPMGKILLIVVVVLIVLFLVRTLLARK